MILDALTFVASFLIAVLLYPIAIDRLRRMKAGQVIQTERSEEHTSELQSPM